ncbi:hypothetical protein MKP08_06715 [Erythrobacter sp. LQ02-29]|uniref:hypothetical protein n=1 Tax=unclassified Erythrobacter TaxID=2633097 RepID=UPI001BFCD037|nr:MULTISPECIES: hypothetical protein [unclassified Erythrobacter]MCP9222434.1 hypothetical protein [Erythrobacter sp. LQ02-29]QWC56272.1 hypothetical protein F7D01_03470 [Erythrobacter sp. 3-20A1M]
MEDATEESLSDRRAKWAVLGSTVALAATVAIAIWLAVAVSVDTEVSIDPGSGTIHLQGTEGNFVGRVRGTYEGRPVLIEGLPVASEIKEQPIAWRAICMVRDDPATDWSEARPMLRSHLFSDRMDELCKPFN